MQQRSCQVKHLRPGLTTHTGVILMSSLARRKDLPLPCLREAHGALFPKCVTPATPLSHVKRETSS
jgi:hypothetical protein